MSAGLTPQTMPENRDETCATFRRELRQQRIERRLALSLDECAVLSAKICAQVQNSFPQLAGLRVGFCWPVNNAVSYTHLTLPTNREV